MNKTLTAAYGSEETLKNVFDELVNAGLPQEKIFVDKIKKEIKAIIPAVTEGSVRSIFQSHKPKSLKERKWAQ